MKTLLPFLFFSLFAFFLSAQDVIIKTDGEEIQCTVEEIGSTMVKYIQWGDPNGVVFSLDRALIKEIKFSYGANYKEKEPEMEDDYFINDRDQALKLDFLALGADVTILTYEKAFDPFSSVEFSAKFIGLGFGNESSSWRRNGFGLDAAYKLKFGSIFNTGYRPRHLMQGFYLKGVVGFSTANDDESVFRPVDYTQFNMGVGIGQQWILKNAAAAEVYLGYRYFGGNFEYQGTSDIPQFNDFNDGNLFGSGNSAVEFGFRIGGLFGKYGQEYTGSDRRRRR